MYMYTRVERALRTRIGPWGLVGPPLGPPLGPGPSPWPSPGPSWGPAGALGSPGPCGDRALRGPSPGLSPGLSPGPWWGTAGALPSGALTNMYKHVFSTLKDIYCLKPYHF